MKVYCKDCRFKPRIFRTGYCNPSIKVKTHIDDYYSEHHYVRKVSMGTFHMAEENKNNDCKHHTVK